VTVLLLDSIGELGSLYRVADGAFVGGSLVPSGGHNILEPAAFGKIPIFGPSMENFAEIAARFVAAGAAIQVESPEDAGVAWIELLRNPERMRRMGDAARGLIEEAEGPRIARLWKSRNTCRLWVPGDRWIFAGIRLLLWPLAFLYGAYARLRAWLYARGWLKQKRLKGMVISIGPHRGWDR